MTPYTLTAHNNTTPLAQGTLLDCWRYLMELASDLTIAEAMMWYRIDKQPLTN